MKKGRLRQFAALILMLSLFLAMGITAGAQVDAAGTGKITISGLESKGKVKSYKVIDVNFDTANQQPKEPIYQWAGEVADWVRNNHSAYIDANGGVTSAFAKATDIKAFVDALASAIKNGTITLQESSSADVTGASVELTEKMGAYLILVEGGMKIYAPGFAKVYPQYEDAAGWTLTADTVSVALKSDSASITKEVDKNTVAIGDTVNYTLTVQIPDYPKNAVNKDFRIGDKLPEGLELVADSVKFCQDADGNTAITEGFTKVDTPKEQGSDFEYQVDTEKITVNKVYVKYSATVMDTAYGKKLENTAYITYNNNPYGTDDNEKATDKEQVYTYGVKITKVGEQDEALSGAQFTLKKKGETASMKFSGSDGKYHISAEGSEALEVDGKGELLLKGLDAGTYILTETKAPSGYAFPSVPDVEITLADGDSTSGPDGELDTGTGKTGASGTILKSNSAEVDSTNKYQLNLTVKNTRSDFQLPVTGGTGTIIFTVVGLLLMALAAAMMVTAFKKRKSNR